MNRRILSLPLALALMPSAAPAQSIPPAGGQFQVNAYTTAFQFNYPRGVASAGDGSFVAVWSGGGSNGSDGDGYGIRLQRFDSRGRALGFERQVNTYTTGDQSAPAVAVLPDGAFTVVWQSPGSNQSDGDGSSVHGRQYGSDGDPLGPQFQINAYTSGGQRTPRIAYRAAGEALLVWDSSGSPEDDTDGASIQARAFAPGIGPGPQFQINAFTTGEQSGADVAAAADGFLVVWESSASAGTDSQFQSIQARRLDALGTPLATDFQVNAYTPESQRGARAALAANGDAFIAWYSEGSPGSDSDGRSIQGRFEPSSPRGVAVELQVNDVTTGRQDRPSVTADPAGGFVVAWQSYEAEPDPSSWTIRGRQIDATGQALGTDFQIESFTTSYQFNPSIAATGPEAFVVLWESGASGESDLDGTSIQGRRFSVRVFADDFESADVCVWSSAEAAPACP